MTRVKICTKCGIEKSFDNFSKNAKNKDGMRSECRECKNAWQREYIKALPESTRRRRQKLTEAWIERNPNKRLEYNLRSRLKKHGMELHEYELMLTAQGGTCAICKGSDFKDPRWKTFAIDHDHETGKVRGLLCLHCNTALGLVDDKIDILNSMISYLHKGA